MIGVKISPLTKNKCVVLYGDKFTLISPLNRFVKGYKYIFPKTKWCEDMADKTYNLSIPLQNPDCYHYIRGTVPFKRSTLISIFIFSIKKRSRYPYRYRIKNLKGFKT